MTLHLTLSEISGAIRESIRAVFDAYGLDVVSRKDGKNLADEKIGEPLNDSHLTKLFHECGNNAAQALVLRDMNPRNK